ncbi:L,D-transpeptidase family protein [Moraxella oblonga]|uniref:L,D-transpeptidase family protein n=1 Tax=Moraxella oblonga TaxID=200413 RepID=UPI00082F4D2C|nr:L,D-transpeptidase family protein [Moraxella oblonga]
MNVAHYYGLAGLLIGLVVGLSWNFGTRQSSAIATEELPVVLTEVSVNDNNAQTVPSLPQPAQATSPVPPPTSTPTSPTTEFGVSHRFSGMDLVDARLAMAFDEIIYNTQDLDDFAKSVNSAVWRGPEDNHNPAVIMRIQALLNWHHHSVGAVDGKMTLNTIKAMHVFQQLHDLPTSNEMNAQTWAKLTANQALMRQPVLVRYQIVDQDFIKVNSKGRSTYKNGSEAIGERFHMSLDLLKQLNKGVVITAGNTITVYNPYEPNKTPIHRVVVKRDQNILYAYDENNRLTATYPTTVNLARTPQGTYQVTSRVLDPVYNKDFSNKKTAISAGPNNPVGRVWIGIDKPTFGIHGSPEPEKISQQSSAGCVRLTNWDALGLFATIENGATVVFD